MNERSGTHGRSSRRSWGAGRVGGRGLEPRDVCDHRVEATIRKNLSLWIKRNAWKKKTTRRLNEVIAGDNLEVMRGMDGATVDLIYAGPAVLARGRTGARSMIGGRILATEGLPAVARRYHSSAMAGYIAFMELRDCASARRVLKPDREYLPTLRPYRKPLPQDAHGCDFRSTSICKRSGLVLQI